MTDSTNNKPSTSQAMRSALTKTQANTTLSTPSAGLKLGGGLHARMRNPAIAAQADPNTRESRLALMLDVSGSMAGDKIQALRDAVSSFITSCDMATTSLALEPFGDGSPSPNRVALTCVQPMLMTTVQMLQSDGSTPMAQAMNYVLNVYSITQGVIVSDGEPDNVGACYASASNYREAGLPVDCVHIGHSSSGEECLRRIAEITGGQYIKFTDVASFSKNFKYLTPAYYAMLTSGAVGAAQLGAKEIK